MDPPLSLPVLPRSEVGKAWSKVSFRQRRIWEKPHLRAAVQRGGLRGVTEEGPGMKARRNLGPMWVQRWLGKMSFRADPWGVKSTDL